MTEPKKFKLDYGGGCFVCHKWIEKGQEAFYDSGKLFHPECVSGAKTFEDDVIDRLAELHDRCKSIEDKLVSLCLPMTTERASWGPRNE